MYMNIRYHKPSQILESAGLIISLLYAFSRLSWGFVFPATVWGILLVLALGMLMLSFLIKKRHENNLLCNICIICMLLIITFDNYHRDFGSIDFWSSILPYFLMGALFICLSANNRWIELFIRFSLLMGLFYAAVTVICSIDNGIYYNIIVPLMRVYSTSYTPHPSAGFTAHYSTNGIYIAIGVIAAITTSLFRAWGNIFKIKFLQWIYLGLFLIALLICGKRGIIIALAAACFVAYYIFNSDKKATRFMRIAGIALLIALVVYLLSLFVPSIENMLSRFSNLNSNDSNVSQRLLLWNYAISGFKNKPIFGNGWRWVMNTNNIFRGADAHNVYIQLLAETGIIGAVFFFIFFIVNLVRAVQLSFLVAKNKSAYNKNEVSYIYFGLIIIIYNLVYMIEGTSLYSPECMIPFFLGAAIIQYYWNQNKKHRNR